MRFGWLAAAAATVCAPLAGAQTYIEYQVSGTGTLTTYPFGGSSFSAPKDFTAIFSADTSGNIFRTLTPYGTFLLDGTTSGVLQLNDSYSIADAGRNINVTVDYGDLDTIGGIPSSLGSNLATGTITVHIGAGSGGLSYDFSGIVTGFTINGPVAAFEDVTIAFTPEPITWALLAIGFGAIGIVIRRRPKPPMPEIHFPLGYVAEKVTGVPTTA